MYSQLSKVNDLNSDNNHIKAINCRELLIDTDENEYIKNVLASISRKF